MRLSSSALTASLTLTLLMTTNSLRADTATTSTIRGSQTVPVPDPGGIESRPIELHQPLFTTKIVKKVLKLTKLKKPKRYHRKARRRARRAYLSIPLPPRIARSSEPEIPSSAPPASSRTFDGPRLGIAIEKSFASTIDPTPYGALIPFPATPPDRSREFLTLRSFAGIDKQIESTVIGIEASVAYRFAPTTPTRRAYYTLGPSGLDASLSARLGTILDSRLLYGTTGFVLANFAKSSRDLRYETLYGGWSVGVGIEQYLTPTTLLRAEYFYKQFPAAHFRTHSVKLGVAIKF